MSNEIQIIRDPRVFANNNSSVDAGLPFQLHNDTGFSGHRNANTKKYRTYNTYNSDTLDISSIVNTYSKICQDPDIKNGSLYKYAEDVIGNKYLLFKTIGVENTITDKYNDLGYLIVLDPEDNILEKLGSVTISDWSLKDIFIVGDILGLVTDNKIILASVYEFEFIEDPYQTHFNYIISNSGNIYLFYDKIPNEFEIVEYKEKTLLTVTKESLDQLITSSRINHKKDRFEVILTNSDVLIRDDQTIQIHEYDILEGVWDGIEFPNFPFEVLGGYSKGSSWFVFHENVTYPNFVGGLQYKMEIPESVVDNQKSTINDDIYIEYGDPVIFPSGNVIVSPDGNFQLVRAVYDTETITLVSPIDGTEYEVSP